MSNFTESKTFQVLAAVVVFFIVLVFLVPMLPNEFYIRTIVLVGVILAAIWWLFSLVNIRIP